MILKLKKDLTPEEQETLNSKTPKRYHEAWIDDVPDNILNKIKNDEHNLFLYGSCGTGKTYILQALRKNYIANTKNIVYYNSTDLADKFRIEALENNQTLNKLLDFKGLIIIDDFGAEKYSEFIEASFYRLINNRWDNMKPVIISSNFTISELAQRIGDRITSRIVGMCDVIEVGGVDKRI